MENRTQNNVVYDGVVFGFRSLIPQMRTMILSTLFAVPVYLLILVLGMLGSLGVGLLLGLNYETYETVRLLAEAGQNPWTAALVLKAVVAALPTFIASCIAAATIVTGYKRIALGVVDTGQGVVKNLLAPWRMSYKVILVILLQTLILLLVLVPILGIFFIPNALAPFIGMFGVCVLAILASIWIIRMQYYIYCIIDRDTGVIDSLRQSWNMTRGYMWPLFALFIIPSLILKVCSFIPYLSIPITFFGFFVVIFANAYIYRQLSR